MPYVQQFFAGAIWPIQQTANLPHHFMEQSQVLFKDRVELLAENNKLRQQQIYLQAQNQKLRALEAENKELLALKKSVGPDKESFFEARVIHVEGDPFNQQFVLNKGNQGGVEIGQPVIDAYGLVGMVQAVSPFSSRVLLVTDAGLSVPVQSLRSGERGICIGSGRAGELKLNYVPVTADFKVGDQLVTSGLGGRYPIGYPVGIVTSIVRDATTRFSLITARPSAKLGQMRYVLIIKQPKVAEEEKAEEDKETSSPKTQESKTSKKGQQASL
jgi:rod shape-determining protein MreC